jgi:transposase InsO family protein
LFKERVRTFSLGVQQKLVETSEHLERLQAQISRLEMELVFNPRNAEAVSADVMNLLSSIKAELIWRNRWETRHQAEATIFQYINGFYNPRRRHSSLGGKSPLAFERMRRNGRQVDTTRVTKRALGEKAANFGRKLKI